MGEVIQFPTADESNAKLFTVCEIDAETEICNVTTATAARNIARILSSEWADRDFLVFVDGREVFRVNQEMETEEL